MSDGNDHFYGELRPFGRFDDFTDFAAYRPVPADWVVMLTDVVGSTAAIADGRYKDVNMVGAASITAVTNACGDVEVPFAFGGDGGTLVVPGSRRPAAAEALMRLQAQSQDMFGLSLRAAAIPVADLRDVGRDVRVRKYELSPRNHLAMFAGGGLERAEELLKDEAAGAAYRLAPAAAADPPDLDGLSCRWEPLSPRNGRMLSVIVRVAGDDQAAEARALGRVLEQITAILGHDLRDSAPASRASMRFRWPPRGLRLEARATAGTQPYWRRYLAVLASSAIQWWCERTGGRAGSYHAPAYGDELRANTDFRKFDGTFRALLDVSPDQAARIEALLEQEYRAGNLVYGTHLARQALMACLVFNLAHSEHVHFIDGADGGFTMAASQFKTRQNGATGYAGGPDRARHALMD